MNHGIEGTAEDKAEIYWNGRGPTKPTLIEWADERIANCKRIAALKDDGDVREGWLEDAWYFEQIRHVLLHKNQTLQPAEGRLLTKQECWKAWSSSQIKGPVALTDWQMVADKLNTLRARAALAGPAHTPQDGQHDS